MRSCGGVSLTYERNLCKTLKFKYFKSFKNFLITNISLIAVAKITTDDHNEWWICVNTIFIFTIFVWISYSTSAKFHIITNKFKKQIASSDIT